MVQRKSLFSKVKRSPFELDTPQDPLEVPELYREGVEFEEDELIFVEESFPAWVFREFHVKDAEEKSPEEILEGPDLKDLCDELGKAKPVVRHVRIYGLYRVDQKLIEYFAPPREYADIVRTHERFHAVHHLSMDGKNRIWERFGQVGPFYGELLAQLFTFKFIQANRTDLLPAFEDLCGRQSTLYNTFWMFENLTLDRVEELYWVIRSQRNLGFLGRIEGILRRNIHLPTKKESMRTACWPVPEEAAGAGERKPRGKVQKLVELSFRESPLDVARTITLAASRGHSYGGQVRPLVPGGGSIFRLPGGTYSAGSIAWLDPAPRGSSFRAWHFSAPRGRGFSHSDLIDRMKKIVAFENSSGFAIREMVPLDGFYKDPDRNDPGTDGYFFLFERSGEEATPVMLDRWLMKHRCGAESKSVPCPVIGCDFVAPRMTKTGRNLESPKSQLKKYLCPRHRIYISPSTFEYEDPDMSILWRAPEDLEDVRFLSSPRSGKRRWKTRGRENDEDSLTWNVFRYLDKNELLVDFLENLPTDGDGFHPPDRVEKVLYWSSDLDDRCPWKELEKARKDIGESPKTGSEPDIVLLANSSLIFIEAKLNAPARTEMKGKRANYQKYLDSIPAPGERPLKTDFKRAVDRIGYELSRFFLLGHALKKRLNLGHFHLILVTREGRERTISSSLADIVGVTHQASFRHVSWNDVMKFLKSGPNRLKDPVDGWLLKRYLKGKTASYENYGSLQTVVK